MRSTLFIVALCATAAAANAEEIAPGGLLDPRVRTTDFVDGQVYKITGFVGYHAVVVFAPDEKVERKWGFDSGWQIDEFGNKVSITPKLENADANLSIVTNKRLYLFDLSVKPFPKGHYVTQANDAEQTYALRFRYPQDEARAAAAEATAAAADRRLASAKASASGSDKPKHMDYTYMGSEAIRPYEVWDDGTFTYFKFYAQQDLPSFFVVNDDGTESVVNKFMKYDGDTVVVQRVAKQFVLRMGQSVTCIYNENTLAMTPSSGTNTTSTRLERVMTGGQP
jgi:type IV secretion system protein VirB9